MGLARTSASWFDKAVKASTLWSCRGTYLYILKRSSFRCGSLWYTYIGRRTDLFTTSSWASSCIYTSIAPSDFHIQMENTSSVPDYSPVPWTRYPPEGAKHRGRTFLVN
jgi:hypothetical protein